ncbi:SGNH/GDSL hydrolase family protein [Streptomyces sp. NPDC057654]|uniref:SGNH/GDSL hydrolase family protein n=1 Tax=Streptomyces sp. NPDC057654 TaxID=3346196 RepID=UPI003675080A
MKLSRIASFVSAATLTTALALAGAGAAHAGENTQTAGKPGGKAATTAYTALGDSYSAGVGAGDYDDSSGDCKRSTKAYPALWAAEHKPSKFTFAACSGARTGDVLSGQLNSLDASTGLVSISVGGNDAGFADTMSTCVLKGEAACLSGVTKARTYIDETLPAQLDKVYSTISSKAPSAHVVVVGYPRFYKLGGSCSVGLSEKSRTAINGAADEINTVTAKRAADHGFAFSDVSSQFTGHEICSGDAWLHSVTMPVDESYHPTATGQAKGYLPAFSSAA